MKTTDRTPSDLSQSLGLGLGSRIRQWSHVSLTGHIGTTKHGHRMKFSWDPLSYTPPVFSAHQTRINTLPVSVLYTEGYVFTEGYILTEGYVFTGGYLFADGCFSLRVIFSLRVVFSLGVMFLLMARFR